MLGLWLAYLTSNNNNRALMEPLGLQHIKPALTWCLRRYIQVSINWLMGYISVAKNKNLSSFSFLRLVKAVC